ncbi:MAG: phage coat protein [Rudaea sp.]
MLPLLTRLSVSLSISPSVGWYDDITGWFVKIVRAIWRAFTDLIGDVIVLVFKAVLAAFSYIVNLIPVPAFMTDNTVGSLLGNAGPVVGWLASEMQLSAALGFIAAGYAFRLTRKLLTLGQW